jgi:UDP-glucose 4-epimerase
MKILVTGAAGFIGSNLVDFLLLQGHEVIGVDNLSTGLERFLEGARRNPRFRFFSFDLLDTSELTSLPAVDYVFHLAANADVRFGLNHPRRDLEQNALVTQNVLEWMREKDCKRIAFSSTGSVYGEPEIFPTPETAPFPRQTSLYGASKMAAEGIISAYCEGFGFEAKVFRFVSILGERYTHGHVFDFVRSLLAKPKELTILGDGRQKKSYLYVGDCLTAIGAALSQPMKPGVEFLNLGTSEYVEVLDSAKEICAEMGVHPEFKFTGGQRGWVGDSPFIFLDTTKVRSSGWAPQRNIRSSVRLTTRYLLNNQWVFETRKH